MKKLLMIGMLALIGTAEAAKWEYATISEVKGGGQVVYFVEGEPSVTKGVESRKAVAEQMKCKAESTDLDISESALLNCFGAMGWELVTIGNSSTSATYTKTFYLKRLNQ